MIADVSLVAAFVAGGLSFSSPCVLPLVPIYLAHLAGVSVGDTGARARARVLASALAYVAGFSLVFVLLGVAFGAAGALVETGSFVARNRLWLVRIGGALLVLLGLHQIGLIRLPFLERERRFRGSLGPGPVTSSFVVGVTFGAGWSPCAGPILGAILTMATGQGSVERAAGLLAAYAAGMAIPFLLAAAAFGSWPGAIRRINRRLHLVSSVSGASMLAVGIIMILGIYQQVFARLVSLAPWTPWEPRL